MAVVDNEAGFRMANAVEFLLEQGYGVDIVTEDFFVGREVVESSEMAWFGRVVGQGALFHPRTEAKSLQGETLLCADRFSKNERRFYPISMVVVVDPDLPDGNLFDRLNAAHPKVIPIGDALAPRLMGEAIRDAHRRVLAS